MEMVNRLTGIGTGIYHQPITAPIDLLPSSDLRGSQADPADQLPILFGDLRQSGYMFLRDDQDMHRRPGTNIPESQNLIIFIDNLRRNLPVSNITKDAAHCLIQLKTKRLRRRRFVAARLIKIDGLIIPKVDIRLSEHQWEEHQDIRLSGGGATQPDFLIH